MATVATERPTLPVPVLEGPHWRVNLRPEQYELGLIRSPAECLRLVEQTQVRLRGWPYPYLSDRRDEQRTRTNGVEVWTDNDFQTEYWRFYQSGQFLHLFGIHETKYEPARQQLEQVARSHLRDLPDGYWSKVPGFIHINSFLRTVTEIFEFATRLCLKSIYRGQLTITIELKDVRGFLLTTDSILSWQDHWESHEPKLSHPPVTVPSSELVANSAEHALQAAIWLFERFGWEQPNVDILRKDQQDFLNRRL